MPPRDAQNEAATVCTFGRFCALQPFGPQFIWAVTLKLPAASSQYSSYCVLACAPAKNELASMPIQVVNLIWSISCSVRTWRVYFMSLPPALSTVYDVRVGALPLP